MDIIEKDKAHFESILNDPLIIENICSKVFEILKDLSENWIDILPSQLFWNPRGVNWISEVIFQTKNNSYMFDFSFLSIYF
jgi:hypothetical protein